MFPSVRHMVHTVICLALCLLVVPAAFTQNLIVNGGFENNPPPNNGNNIGWSVSPWTLGPGNSSNVVQVDGPGGFEYGNRGPQSDASNNGQGAGAGVSQHYLDITDGANDFYQSFTVPTCGGPSGQSRVVNFSGWFSTRGDKSGHGAITMRRGVGFNGDQLARVDVNLPVPSQGSEFTPWQKVQGQITVQAGEKFSMIVSMDDPVNFDEAYLAFDDNSCKSAPLTLQKQWVDAVINDNTTVSVSRNGSQIDSITSTASTANKKDTDNTPVTVFEEETLDLAETLNSANAGKYAVTVNCTGGGTLNGTKLTVNNSGNPITCTYNNSTHRAELTIKKSNQVDQVTQGKPFDYLIDVTNTGPSAADGATLKDPQTNGLSCTSISCAVTSGNAMCPDTTSISGLQSGLEIPKFPANSSLRFTLTCSAQ